jgi:DNA invertase Pin-like site-specific DNA recombinase
MEHNKHPVRRCAIYTRKSSDEGLERDFNSLQAQREACEAFIRSQTGEGWGLIKTHYDDGGLSGGTMERPALQRLLDDIRKELVDVVVVYKVDRLTRALADFAKMVEIFDANGVSFVAVTQQFNTTTSMGRLTLNVLLSFAQFEREVTGERIRDKLAASKRKGIWMGGTVPLGYDVRERRLVINEAEAQLVRQIYQRYLELGSVRLLKLELDQQGVVSKVRLSRKGSQSGGKSFSRGALYELLSNPIYIGAIRHKRQSHPGQHEPILERETWDQIQQHLSSGARRDNEPTTQAPPSPLTGKVVDQNGEPLYAQGAAKGPRRYRYFVSRSLIRGTTRDGACGWRVPAPELERLVLTAAQSILADQAALMLSLQDFSEDAENPEQILGIASNWRKRLSTEGETLRTLGELTKQVQLTESGLRLTLNLPLVRVGAEPAGMVALSHFVPLRMKRRGIELRLILDGHIRPPSEVDPVLFKALARARAWFEEVASGRAASLAEIARREGLQKRYVTRLTKLAFMAPSLAEAIAGGRTPIGVNLQMLMDGRLELAPCWFEQEQMFSGLSSPR